MASMLSRFYVLALAVTLGLALLPAVAAPMASAKLATMLLVNRLTRIIYLAVYTISTRRFCDQQFSSLTRHTGRSSP